MFSAPNNLSGDSSSPSSVSPTPANPSVSYPSLLGLWNSYQQKGENHGVELLYPVLELSAVSQPCPSTACPDNVIPICTQDDAPQSTLPSFRPGCVIIAIFYGQVTVDSMSNTRYKEHDRSLSNHYTLLCGALLSVWKEFGKLKVAVVRTPCHFKRQDNRRTNLDHHTNNVSSPGGVTAITYKKLVISNRGYLYDWYSVHFG